MGFVQVLCCLVIFMFVLDLCKVFKHTIINITNGITHHSFKHRLIFIKYAKVLHFAKTADNILGDIVIVRSPGEPRPATIA